VDDRLIEGTTTNGVETECEDEAELGRGKIEDGEATGYEAAGKLADGEIIDGKEAEYETDGKLAGGGIIIVTVVEIDGKEVGIGGIGTTKMLDDGETGYPGTELEFDGTTTFFDVLVVGLELDGEKITIVIVVFVVDELV
jgi:hypothetical protein